MSFLATLLILAAPGAAPIEDRPVAATDVFRCDFGETWDKNFDDWPDGWTRRRGRQFPAYVKIAIAREAGKAEGSGAWLRVDLDGGAAAVYSPAVEVSPLRSYVLTAKVKTEKLKHDVALVDVVLYDSQGQPAGAYQSAPQRGLQDWTQLRVGPITAARDEVHRAIIGLHVRPTEKADLEGAVLFDDIRLTSGPRITLTASRPYNLYTSLDQVAVTCRVSGISAEDPSMDFELRDVDGQRVAAVTRRRATDPTGSGVAPPRTQSPADPSGEEEWAVTWKPQLPDFGFYRARVSVRNGPGDALEETLNLAVVRPEAAPQRGPFGWSLPQGEDPLPMDALIDLLGQAGVHWAKFPVWCDEQDQQRAGRLASLAERLRARGIEMVGLLDQPPEDAGQRFRDAQLLEETEPLSAASVFLKPELWRPILEPVMMRLGRRIRWWQLGADDDFSFVDLPGLTERVQEIRSQLQQSGHRVHLGIGWRWTNETPSDQAPPWDFLFCTADPSLTSDELQTYLAAEPGATAARWIAVQPLPRSAYSLETRTRDLVLRMLQATIHGAGAIFVPEPFSDQRGLMTPRGAPAELLIPWRTTALAVSGAQYLGELQLPHGSRNCVFARDGQAVMAVWSDRPATETIFLGDNVRQIDLWGRVRAPDRSDPSDRDRQEIAVGRLPIFLTGMDLPLAQWRLSLTLDRKQVPTVLGRRQTINCRFRNFLDTGVGGELLLHAPNVGQWQPRQASFKLAAGEEMEQTYRLLLRPDANTGVQPVRLDFEIVADRIRRFSVYRTIQVGLGDVAIEMNTQLSDGGDLIVEQHLLNRTENQVSFNCLLFAPDRRRQRIQVLNASPGRTTHRFILPRGKDLLGKAIWLRAEEVNGPRVLNYRLVAAP